MALVDSNQNGRASKRNVQLAGLFLWRLGLIIAGTTAVFRTARFALRFIELPTQLEIGAGLLISGLVLFVASFVMERLVDARSEGDLKR